nr:DEAD/DEAH box helicase [Solobacterium sp.]
MTRYTEEIKKAMDAYGYERLLPVQEKVIPLVEEGRNLFVQAETGSGKTAAYLIPLIRQDRKILVLAPTRELAVQIAEECEKLSVYTRRKQAACIGGIDIRKQENILRYHPATVIGTPGRILDLLDQDKLDTEFDAVVLDEADALFATGQFETVRDILHWVRCGQFICLSATMDEQLKGFFPHEFETVILDRKQLNTSIQAFKLLTEHKFRTLLKILNKEPVQQAIIFVNYRSTAAELAKKLAKRGILCEGFSAAVEEKDRLRIIRDLKAGRLRVLVATDAASRGLDAESVSHIIHYDPPADEDTFIQRSGRTAHRQNSGTAILLLKQEELTDEYAGLPDYIFLSGENDLDQPLEKKTEENGIYRYM